MRKSIRFAVAAVLQLSAAVAIAQTRSLGPPWQHRDIGDVGAPGGVSGYDDGEISYMSITGSGSDIWGTADGFFFVYQPIEDGEIATSSRSLENTDPHAKVGLMFRQTLDAGAPDVILDVQPDGSVEFMTRQRANGETTFIGGLPPTNHQWYLRLVRSNGIITGFACDGGTCQTVGSTPFVDGRVFVGAAVTSHANGVLNHASLSGIPIVLTVPRPWFSSDFNLTQVGIRGSAFFQHDTFTVTGAGTDIWGTADSYHDVANQLSGDGTITARVTREDAQNTFAKAGVMLRFGNQLVILDVRPNGLIEFMQRPVVGGEMSFVAGAAASFPVWLKVQRIGDVFTGFISDDGSNWEFVGTTTVHMPTTVAASLAVTSHDPSALNTSTFDHVVVSSAPGHDIDVGDTGATGSFALTDAGFTIMGAGADIWGTQDAFNFAYETMHGDGQMQLRILHLDNTDMFAKAGIMIRTSTDPSSAHVILDVRPDGTIEFMARGSAGSTMSFLGTAHVSFPVTLNLYRVGTHFNASYSQDGTSWTFVHVGSTDLDIGTDALIGIAVTSHQRGMLATATFDNLTR
jgi:hypothetical protein